MEHHPKNNLFSRIYEWAVLPVHRSFDVKSAIEKRRLYKNNFRWLRSERVAGFCKPFQTANRIGWSFISPIDIKLSKIEEVQFEGSNEEAQQIATQLGLNHVWERGGIKIGIKTETPLRLYDFKRQEDIWEAMFIINGEGSLEWKLGFDINIHPNQNIIILDDPMNPKGICLNGVLSYKQLKKINESTGFALPVKPTSEIIIKRGDVIGMFMIVTNETIALNLQ